ncbi:unnamed protein product [Paramecium sonneborni]|uniref:Uncharacterized protein n=1 Tax=Paramecium sonneborni TaxID=65129 RepID=A0A8S1PXC4_9CILI|nr:unnamed protein product [Paramecium sonneborni]
MKETEEDLFCSLKHKLPVLMIACDKDLKKNQRLLCSLCMENLESKTPLMSFKKALENIQDSLIGNSNEWIKQVQICGQTNVTYSFLDETEKLITQTKLEQMTQHSIIDQINQIKLTNHGIKRLLKNQIYLTHFKKQRIAKNYQEVLKMTIKQKRRKD